MEKEIEKAGKKEITLIAGILAAAAFLALILTVYRTVGTKNPVAVVTVDGVEYARYPLNADREEKIVLPDGSYNVMVIRDGMVDMTEASCPDQICVRHKNIDKKDETIVCLPNRVIIRVENGEESGLDAVAWREES